MEGSNSNSKSAGKGDKPRNCFSQKYRDNFDLINWKNKNKNCNVTESKRKYKLLSK
jgi:hypothetical protein